MAYISTNEVKEVRKALKEKFGKNLKFSVTSVLVSLNGIAYEKDNGPIGLYQFTEIPVDDLILLESSELL